MSCRVQTPRTPERYSGGARARHAGDAFYVPQGTVLGQTGKIDFQCKKAAPACVAGPAVRIQDASLMQNSVSFEEPILLHFHFAHPFFLTS